MASRLKAGLPVNSSGAATGAGMAVSLARGFTRLSTVYFTLFHSDSGTNKEVVSFYHPLEGAQ